MRHQRWDSQGARFWRSEGKNPDEMGELDGNFLEIS